MIEVSLSSHNPFRPHQAVRGHLAELRDRKHPDDLMEMDWEAGLFSVNRDTVIQHAQEQVAHGWEARILPGVAEQMLPGGNYILHRLH